MKSDPFNPRRIRHGVYYEKVILCQHGRINRHRFLIAYGPHGATRTDACEGATRININRLRMMWELWRMRKQSSFVVEQQ